MDLLEGISAQLGLEPDKAAGLAGTVLGMVKTQVAEKLGQAEAEELEAQVPELGQWKGQAPAEPSEADGGLLGGLGSLLGSGQSSGGGLDLGALLGVVGKFDLGADDAQKLIPLVMQFLQSRLSGSLMGKILEAVPLLKGAQGGGGIAGALGSLLG